MTTGAICEYCGHNMLKAKSCVSIAIKSGGVELRPIPYGTNERDSEVISKATHGNCHDCNVAWGGFHHPGCDMEVCPKCSGQLISCGCIDEEPEDEYEIIED